LADPFISDLPMKKPIPTPVIIGAAVAVIAAVVFFFVKATTVAENPPPPRLPGYKEGLPDYVKDAREGRQIDPSKIPGGPGKDSISKIPAGAVPGATGGQ